LIPGFISGRFCGKKRADALRFYSKNGLITSSQSFSLNLIDGGLRSYERCAQLKNLNIKINYM